MSNCTTVLFTEYVRPRGQKRQLPVILADEDGALARQKEAIHDAGLRLTAERIGPEWCLCAEDHERGDFLIEMSTDNTKAARLLLLAFDRARYDAWANDYDTHCR